MTLTLVSYSTNQAPFIAGIRKLLNKINWLFFLAEKIWNDVCVAFFFFLVVLLLFLVVTQEG